MTGDRTVGTSWFVSTTREEEHPEPLTDTCVDPATRKSTKRDRTEPTSQRRTCHGNPRTRSISSGFRRLQANSRSITSSGGHREYLAVRRNRRTVHRCRPRVVVSGRSDLDASHPYLIDLYLATRADLSLGPDAPDLAFIVLIGFVAEGRWSLTGVLGGIGLTALTTDVR